MQTAPNFERLKLCIAVAMLMLSAASFSLSLYLAIHQWEQIRPATANPEIVEHQPEARLVLTEAPSLQGEDAP